jgi:hypothetical protein
VPQDSRCKQLHDLVTHRGPQSLCFVVDEEPIRFRFPRAERLEVFTVLSPIGSQQIRNPRYLCSREHNQAVFVLPGAQILLDCAPGSTNAPGLCSWEHKHRWIVLPGAQILLDCSPGSTNIYRDILHFHTANVPQSVQ